MTPALIRATVEAMRALHVAGPNRRDETAMGVEGAVTLATVVDQFAGNRERVRVADLGSGFSSSLLRWQARAHENVEVWTVDTEWKWLGTTLRELEAQGLGTAHCHHLDVFDSLPLDGAFDLLFVDIGPTPVRVRLAATGRLAAWLAPGGLMLLDDWQMAHYREPMQSVLESQDFAVKVCRGTWDKHRRYLAEARKVGI